jgi:heat shock protein HtpX
MATGRANFGRDTGLQVRIVGTLFLLGLVYALLIGVFIAVGAGAVTVLVIAALLFTFQLFTSDKIALAAAGAREVSVQEAPELHAIIERLCVQADLPKPRVAIADTTVPNAFAMGRSPKAATVCATSGLLRLLDPAELEGVLAHEISHIVNRDVMVMTLASFFASIAGFIAQWGFLFNGFGGGGGRGDDRDNFGIAILVSIVVYAISFVLLRTLSRYREFAADRGSAVLTGRPSALSSALLKISGTIERVPQQDLRQVEGLSAFFIVPARAKQSLMNLFSDHPPLEKRLAALSRLEAQLQHSN